MRIDADSGALHTSQGVITPKLGLRAFLKTLIGSKARELIRNEDKITYNVRLSDADSDWGIGLLFEGEILSVVNFSPASKDDSWGNWSEEKEMEKESQLRKLLHISLGEPPHVFDWGEAIVEMDVKGGAAQAILKYRTECDSSCRKLHGN